jgi:hypothetical protein
MPGRFFCGYFGNYCYLPLYIFCGEFLLCARLRPSNIDAGAGAREEAERIVGRIRAKRPRVAIVLRGDSGFCRDEIMAWCEDNGVDYVLGLAGTEMARAQCTTIRLKLLKMGAQIRISVRKVWLHLSAGHPGAALFEAVYRNLQAATLRC